MYHLRTARSILFNYYLVIEIYSNILIKVHVNRQASLIRKCYAIQQMHIYRGQADLLEKDLLHVIQHLPAVDIWYR